jgi:NADP-dependent aldehyde dehydrogenase
MSSVNPVFILPHAMRERRDQIAAGLHASVTLGAGQFCTKPGLVLMAADANAQAFAGKLGELMASTADFTLLTSGIHSAYQEGVTSRVDHPAVEVVAQKAAPEGQGGCQVGVALFRTDMKSYLEHPELGAEVFGPSTLLISHSGRADLLEFAGAMESHLTATIHGTEEDLREYADLLALLETKVGRLIFNGFPTGVEVCHAMVHGGPYPATSDGRSTSVGTRAILRFTRPVCYQGFPDAGLPDELKDDNPLGIWRLVDGQWTRD